MKRSAKDVSKVAQGESERPPRGEGDRESLIAFRLFGLEFTKQDIFESCVKIAVSLIIYFVFMQPKDGEIDDTPASSPGP